MEDLLTIQSSGVLHQDEALEIDEFFATHVEPLVQKFKYRLTKIEQTVDHYTLHKIQKVYASFDTFDKAWCDRRQKKSLRLLITDTLSQALMDLSRQYRELEASLPPTDNTIDEVLTKVEELESYIADALEQESLVRYKLHGHIGLLKNAMANGAKRLLRYEELPAPWQANQVRN
ncbi:hypothetical protein DFQ28_003206 [Apophysomyces sp. BC1034]|nr:hypothetical protein DFQ30_000055 [Apophysomyces sp. BC1015]KAG0183434.1 hypothetical protein DFQ29_004378 [Apophysomyces sp. BC1021]KAG0193802.1 hypothetical protein DFQ28_003206 [Apophysomyces sp. BC1034]